jgi:hypothetical protein
MDSLLANGSGSGLSLRLGIVTLFLAYAIYTYFQRRQEYVVCVPSEFQNLLSRANVELGGYTFR